jgi:hypothetical protein
MQAAEHGAQFPMADKLRQSMTHQQLHDFASGSEKGKPEHVNTKSTAKKSTSTSFPHRNLGTYLHPKKAR